MGAMVAIIVSIMWIAAFIATALIVCYTLVKLKKMEREHTLADRAYDVKLQQEYINAQEERNKKGDDAPTYQDVLSEVTRMFMEVDDETK